MSFLDILYKILIGPLQLVFEIIFTIANRFIGHPGLAIIVLSLIMNFLVLPLYRRADALQEEERDIQAKLQDGVAHIKKTFSGDERMMMLQTYYRQNNYKPTDALNGSISLLLEIPFFIAAYQFLSHLPILQGVSLGPIRDLGSPDALLVIGGLSINILPILMTTINVVSSAIYLKGFPLKAKVQLYGMAAVFLVFLYNSPAGLVFYWTLNNIFSCLKNIFYKLKNPRKVLGILFSVAGIVLFTYGAFVYDDPSLKRKVFLLGVAVLFQLPLLTALLKNKVKVNIKLIQSQPNQKVFLLCSLFLTVLVGLLIPSNIIAASPQEFVDVTYFYNPLWYLVSSSCLSIGMFLVWMRVFYWLASDSGKVIFDKIVWILCGVMLVNYMFFGTDLGIITSNLQYEDGMTFTLAQQCINILIITAVAAVSYFVFCKWSKVLSTVLLTAVIAVSGMFVLNIVNINTAIADIDKDSNLSSESDENLPSFTLSTEGKNVIVFMLDRGIGEYIPYLFDEKPELKEQFDGFVHYSNTASVGGHTNFTAPALFGGYEYTPIEMNKRDAEKLVVKHNEALKVLPVLFNEHGYDVTVCDAPQANYKSSSDLSIYDDYPDIQTYNTKGKFTTNDSKVAIINDRNRNFFCFGVMKAFPLFLQPTIYNEGIYNSSSSTNYVTQVMSSTTVANGVSAEFMREYQVLVNLPEITNIVQNDTNTFLMLENSAAHRNTLLQQPTYEPKPYVNNSLYAPDGTYSRIIDGKTLTLKNEMQITHYHVNMAAFLKLGDWFDFMRENNVYDNTRIILVSDHGYKAQAVEGFKTIGGRALDYFYPMLMVKDFNSKGFKNSNEFMTNADVPTLATQDLIESPVNPFTGKLINTQEKITHEQYLIMSWEYSINENNGYTYFPSTWITVKDDIWNPDNWRYIDEKTTMPSELLD